MTEQDPTRSFYMTNRTSDFMWKLNLDSKCRVRCVYEGLVVLQGLLSLPDLFVNQIPPLTPEPGDTAGCLLLLVAVVSFETGF